MTEQGKVHYLLVRGYEEFHDEDEWLGIYSTWENADDNNPLYESV